MTEAALVQILQAFFPIAIGLATTASAWYLGKKRQQGELSEKQALLGMRQQEWIAKEIEARTAELRADRNYYRDRLEQFQIQTQQLDAKADQTIRELIEQKETLSKENAQLRKDNALLTRIHEEQQAKIQRLELIIPSGGLLDPPPGEFWKKQP